MRLRIRFLARGSRTPLSRAGDRCGFPGYFAGDGLAGARLLRESGDAYTQFR
jgi:hypothetical protein